MAEENKPVEDLNNDESLDANSLTVQDNKSDSTQEDNTIPDEVEINEIKENFNKSKKKTTLSKILISLIAFLLFLLFAGAILFFLGFFEPEEIIQNKPTQENSLKEEEKEENTYKFDIKDINSKKLNEQLSYLTNKNTNQDKNEELERIENEKKLIEEQKIKEEELLKAEEEELLKEKNAIEEKKIELENEKIQLEAMKQEAILLKQELEANKIQLEVNNEQNTTEKPSQEAVTTTIVKEQKQENSFLKLINVAKIKGNLYKNYLDNITSINTNVILCRDDKNRIEIYFGPFNNNESRSDLLNILIKEGFEEAYELELTQEEFDKRCNY